MRTRNRKQKRRTRKQRRKRGGVAEIAAYVHFDERPDSILAPVQGMTWKYGPYMYRGDIGEGWYISEAEKRRVEQQQEEINAHNASQPSNTEMDNFMEQYS